MPPTIVIAYDRLRWEEKMLVKAGVKKGIRVKTIDVKEEYLGTYEDAENLRKKYGDITLQRCISHFRGLHLTAFLEAMGLRVVNNFHVSETCGNKLYTTLSLMRAGVPTPHTAIAFTSDAALRSLDDLGYPAVIKPVTGSWGRMVVSVTSRRMAKSIIEMREELPNPLHHIYYAQEMVKRPPRDVRAVVVGDSVVACIYRYAPKGEWRTNVAIGGYTEPRRLEPDDEERILKAARAVGGGVLGVDAMENQDGLLIHEVNSTVEFRGASSVSHNDIPSAIIDYLLKEAKK